MTSSNWTSENKQTDVSCLLMSYDNLQFFLTVVIRMTYSIACKVEQKLMSEVIKMTKNWLRSRAQFLMWSVFYNTCNPLYPKQLRISIVLNQYSQKNFSVCSLKELKRAFLPAWKLEIKQTFLLGYKCFNLISNQKHRNPTVAFFSKISSRSSHKQ